MTDLVTDLSCPDGENYAAVALQMQETALEAESRIFLLEQLARAAGNRPCIVQTSTAAITGIPIDSDTSIGPFNGGAFAFTFNNTGLSQDIDSARFDLLGEGLYQVGIYANLTATGTADPDRHRYFTIQHVQPDPLAAGGESLVNQAQWTQVETNPVSPTGTDACITLTCRIGSGDRLKFLANHGNFSSTMQAPAGTVIWLMKISTDDTVTVV